jgi:hypothetical protein
MPLTIPQFSCNWVSIKAAGYIERADVEAMLNAVKTYATDCRNSVGIIIEDNGTEFISNGARLLLAEATSKYFVRAVTFVTEDNLLAQTIRTIMMLGEHGRVLLFASTDAAHEYLQSGAQT